MSSSGLQLSEHSWLTTSGPNLLRKGLTNELWLPVKRFIYMLVQE